MVVATCGPGKFYGNSLPRPRFYSDVKLSEYRVDPPSSVLDPFLNWANDAHWSMGGLNFKRHRLQGRIEGNIKKLRTEQEKMFKRKKDSAMATDLASDPLTGGNEQRRKRRAFILDDDEESDLVDEEKEAAAAADDDDEEDESVAVVAPVVGNWLRRKMVRKLGDDFDKAASVTMENGSPGRSPLTKKKNRGGRVDKDLTNSSPSTHADTVASRTRSRGSEKVETPEGLNGSSPNRDRKLQGRNKAKAKANAGGGVSPSSGNRTSPRLSKQRLN